MSRYEHREIKPGEGLTFHPGDSDQRRAVAGYLAEQSKISRRKAGRVIGRSVDRDRPCGTTGNTDPTSRLWSG